MGAVATWLVSRSKNAESNIEAGSQEECEMVCGDDDNVNEALLRGIKSQLRGGGLIPPHDLPEPLQ